MALIKVTGYIDTEGLDPDYVDLTHDMGVSDEGYIEIGRELASAGLEDAEFELED